MDWLVDALLDSLKLLPFLFLAYVLIELLETYMSKKVVSKKFYKGKFAPLVGAGFGIVPQCGFSVVATDLYSQKKITVGTLIAIFIATSDEAIPILFGKLNSAKVGYTILILIAVKFIVGVIAGYLVDLAVYGLRKRKTQNFSTEVVVKNEEEKSIEHDHKHEEHEEDHSEEISTHHKGCCGHEIEENKVHPAKQYLLHPLIHTLKIFAYILIINIAFSALIYYIGEDKITDFLTSAKYFAPLVATLIGLIPNCASSVVLTNLMVIGGLNLSACISGLIVNAGIAYTILFKQNKNMKANFAIIGIVSAISIGVGYLLMLFGL